MVVQTWGRVLVPTQGICLRLSLSPSVELVPTQVEDGDFRLSSGFLQHCSVTSPPTNQKKVSHPAALIPNLAFLFWAPVSFLVWLLSVSSPTESKSFKLNCCYQDGECWFQAQSTLIQIRQRETSALLGRTTASFSWKQQQKKETATLNSNRYLFYFFLSITEFISVFKSSQRMLVSSKCRCQHYLKSN